MRNLLQSFEQYTSRNLIKIKKIVEQLGNCWSSCLFCNTWI